MEASPRYDERPFVFPMTQLKATTASRIGGHAADDRPGACLMVSHSWRVSVVDGENDWRAAPIGLPLQATVKNEIEGKIFVRHADEGVRLTSDSRDLS